MCIYISIYIYTYVYIHTYIYHRGTKLKQNEISTHISPMLSLLVYLSKSGKVDLVIIYLKHCSGYLSRRRMRKVVGNEGVPHLRE